MGRTVVETKQDSVLRQLEAQENWGELAQYFWNMFALGTKTQRVSAERQYDTVITDKARRSLD